MLWDSNWASRRGGVERIDCDNAKNLGPRHPLCGGFLAGRGLHLEHVRRPRSLCVLPVHAAFSSLPSCFAPLSGP